MGIESHSVVHTLKNDFNGSIRRLCLGQGAQHESNPSADTCLATNLANAGSQAELAKGWLTAAFSRLVG